MASKDEVRKIDRKHQYNPAKKGEYEVIPATESLPLRDRNRKIQGDKKIS